MSAEEKQRLIDLLTETYSKVIELVQGVDAEVQVYPETDWRVRDIIGHLAVWDREVAKSIRAYQGGGEYSIPDLDEDGFNNQNMEELRKLSGQEVFKLWEDAREEFVAAVRDMSLDDFESIFLYPWDERGRLSTLVEDMTDHDVLHRMEIEKSLKP